MFRLVRQFKILMEQFITNIYQVICKSVQKSLKNFKLYLIQLNKKMVFKKIYINILAFYGFVTKWTRN